MESDKQLYQLFSAAPSFFFDLTGLSCTSEYHFQSVRIKEFSREMDGLMTPASPEHPWLVVEFQMQYDATIYSRLVMAMAALGYEHPQRVYQGVIVFNTAGDDPRSEPWFSLAQTKQSGLRVFYLEELLENLASQQPQHPMLAVFQPYIEPHEERLVSNAKTWYRQIQKAPLKKPIKERLSNVFINWLMVRFTDLPYQEVLDMIALTTPLEETRAYKEIAAKATAKIEKEKQKIEVEKQKVEIEKQKIEAEKEAEKQKAEIEKQKIEAEKEAEKQKAEIEKQDALKRIQKYEQALKQAGIDPDSLIS